MVVGVYLHPVESADGIKSEDEIYGVCAALFPTHPVITWKGRARERDNYSYMRI